VGGWLGGLTQPQVSRVENGAAVEDLRRLVPWARVLGIPGELLWFRLPGGGEGVTGEGGARAGIEARPACPDEATIPARLLVVGGQPPGIPELAISHSTDEFAPERTHAASQAAAARGATWVPRSKEAIAGMFSGRAPVDPGLVLVSRWRPDSEPDPDADQAWTYCGIAPV
jgi:hypothetical protein